MPHEQAERIEITPGGKVLLFLPGQSRREIGWITRDTFHCRRDSVRHIHSRGRSVGFNYLLVRTGTFRFITVHVMPAGPHLSTTRQHILAKGKFFHYKKPGFERQIFLSLDEFGLEKASETERNLAARKPENRQPGLFDEKALAVRE